MSKLNSLILAAVLAVALVLGACAHSEPFEYESYNEVKPGRGVFTGEKGTWTIFRQEMPAEPQTASAEAPGDRPQNQVANDGHNTKEADARD
ncbi:MAG: hypothetical protein QNJ48_04970 [Desulfobacterales bacterium]|nr:hypothetical protein [Desulfobacterales bacterium]MDJ0873783.1 hypothetical protein [Desulfobacterales bacterium]MDJ0883486.1 hypothetical protein [Desulfobacterales bacterium]